VLCPEAEIRWLSGCDEPSCRYALLVNVLGKSSKATEIVTLKHSIKTCARTSRLLSLRDEDGQIPLHPYSKWMGAHWVLVSLADLNYPIGDSSLLPLREQVLGWLLKRRPSIVHGRVRHCASIEANALYSLTKLGLADERTEQIAHALCDWQWPDGGWNCDKSADARTSSFTESLIPMRALSLHAKVTSCARSLSAAFRAKEMFLRRRLYRRVTNGEVINEQFVRLHYPCYWHYDILFALKVMAEAGFINDPRCGEALELLVSKRLPEGGFPAESKYWHTTAKSRSGKESVDWGPVSRKKPNPFVSVDALYVLKSAGMLSHL